MTESTIVKLLGEPEILTQLAEEASELAQAALKLRRALTGDNPTPKSQEECRKALIEEMADVELCLMILGYWNSKASRTVGEIIAAKAKRWGQRLEEKGKEGKEHG